MLTVQRMVSAEDQHAGLPLPLPPQSSTKSEEVLSSRHQYRFTGKLAMFPLMLIFLFVGAVALLRYGRKSYSTGYFQSREFFIFGIAGIVVSAMAVALVVLFIRYTVLVVRFDFGPEKLVITKRGAILKSRFEFSIRDTSFCYYRSHYLEKEAWLTLVVKEGNVYYFLLSWKCTSEQKFRFFSLLHEINEELHCWKGDGAHVRLPACIVCKEEAAIMMPFGDPLVRTGIIRRSLILETLELAASDSSAAARSPASAPSATGRARSFSRRMSVAGGAVHQHLHSSPTSSHHAADPTPTFRARPNVILVKESLPKVVDFDQFWRHFGRSKTI